MTWTAASLRALITSSLEGFSGYDAIAAVMAAAMCSERLWLETESVIRCGAVRSGAGQGGRPPRDGRGAGPVRVDEN